MNKYILYVIAMSLLLSCGENPKIEQGSAVDLENNSETSEDQGDLDAEKLEVSMEELGEFIKMGQTDPDQTDTTSVESTFKQLGKLLEMGGVDPNEIIADSIQGKGFSTEAILDMLEASGVSREEMEKLINNPDSLAILAAEATKNRETARKEEATQANKGKISREQLKTKSTTTGMSLEEAILLVQAESGPEATMEKLKLIDSMAGTNVMEQMDLKDAQYVFNDVDRKNEPPASPEEERTMERLKIVSGQIHSDKEAAELLAELELTEKDIASGKLKASPKFQRSLNYSRYMVRTYHSDFVRKSKEAKKKFQQLNPDLYFGEEAGNTYIGSMKKTVYLPLGKLAFADEVIEVHHPKLQTKDSKNVLGEPDMIHAYGDINNILSGIYSLGLAGDLTVRFVDNALTDVNGPDLYIFEIGKIEPTELEISKDGKKWIKVGKIDGGVAEVDIAEFVKPGELYYYVRLKDLKEYSDLPGADVDAIAAIGAAMRLNLDSKVLFATGKSDLKPEGLAAIEELSESIKVLQRGNVIVEGHTDDVGSDETNRKLSLERARSVSAALKKIIPGTKFKWSEKGHGESKPLVENDSDVNRARNRRVEILVLPN